MEIFSTIIISIRQASMVKRKTATIIYKPSEYVTNWPTYKTSSTIESAANDSRS